MESVTCRSIPAVTLIIPTYRREDMLIDCLKCALAQNYRPLEILVIDQTESHLPATREFLSLHSGKIRLIHLSQPSAVTARNCALREATGDILIFIDDDTTYEPTFVDAHVEAHRRGADVVQGRVMEPGRTPSYRAQWMLPWLRIVGSNTYDQSSKTNTLTGCNFSISRKAAERVGEFDTNFTGVLIREDADYGARCYKAGLRMVFDANAFLLHHRDSTGGVDAHMQITVRMFEADVIRNELYFARKHFPVPVVWMYQWRMMRRFRRLERKTGIKPPLPPRQMLSHANRAAKALLKP